jgi:Undecaprenyl-phosphate galactose phosphotransferase WbaP
VSGAAVESGGTTAPVRLDDGSSNGYRPRLILLDAAICAVTVALGAQLHFYAKPAWSLAVVELVAIPIAIALLAVWGSYRREVRWRREVPALLAGTAIGFTLGEWLVRLPAAGSEAASFFLVAFLLGRLLVHVWAGKRPRRATSTVVILGNTETARSLYRALLDDSRRPINKGGHGLRVAAIFADGSQEQPAGVDRELVVGDTQWAKSFSECCDIHCGIIAVPSECDSETAALVEKSAGIFRNVFVAPQIAGGEVRVAVIRGERSKLAIQVGNCAAPSEVHWLKRTLDVVGALSLFLLTLPFLWLVALSIRLSSKGPILYKQLRIGKGNRVFRALKFRTMFVDARDRLDHYLEKDLALQAEWESVHKLRDDPRVTAAGRFLRRFSLDELPQLWNVLVGDMSLVGPRPIVVSEIERYGLDYAAYEAVRPGLTGLWQVSGRNDTTYQQRVDYDSYYVRNWTLRLDARIVAKTFRAVISGVGAY